MLLKHHPSHANEKTMHIFQYKLNVPTTADKIPHNIFATYITVRRWFSEMLMKSRVEDDPSNDGQTQTKARNCSKNTKYFV